MLFGEYECGGKITWRGLCGVLERSLGWGNCLLCIEVFWSLRVLREVRRKSGFFWIRVFLHGLVEL